MKFIFPGWLYLKIIQDDAKVLNPRSGSKSHNVDKVWSNWWCLIYGKYLSQVVLPTSSLLVFFCVDDVILRAILGVSWPPFAPEFRCLLFTGQPPLPAGYLRWSQTMFSVLFMTMGPTETKIFRFSLFFSILRFSQKMTDEKLRLNFPWFWWLYSVYSTIFCNFLK